MHILLSGASGLIGRAVAARFVANGHCVDGLVRGDAAHAGGGISWDPAAGKLDAARLEGFDTVIHLAGESIAGGRWTAAKKARIRDSRVLGTQLLCTRLAETAAKPKLLISASAIGLYGDRGEELLDEQSAVGSGFLADVCRQWEQATQPAVSAGIRTVQVRIGLVLAAAGGALAKLITPFRLGLGGRLGSGRQYLSWIALDDLARIFHFLCGHEELRGPVNAVSPYPVTNNEFTKALGRVLRRPTLCAVPKFALRIALGEAADELLLSSARVTPRKLLEAGFQFRYSDLRHALAAIV